LHNPLLNGTRKLLNSGKAFLAHKAMIIELQWCQIREVSLLQSGGMFTCGLLIDVKQWVTNKDASILPAKKLEK